MTDTKIIVLDDDPTGSQTVHSCLLLTRWDAATLQEALLDEAPLFFVLTNTRGMDAARAAAVTGEVCGNLKLALADLAAGGHRIQPILVSRSDSTLRGHYPVETDVIAEKLGPFDAHFLVPAFFEGGRFTRDSVHYLMVDGKPTPVHETEFARDSVFGYRHSYLPDYVEEKTGGRIQAGEVERVLLADLRARTRLPLPASPARGGGVISLPASGEGRGGENGKLVSQLHRITPYGQFSLTPWAGSMPSTLRAKSVSASDRARRAWARSNTCRALPNMGGSSISPSNLMAPPSRASASTAAWRTRMLRATSVGDGV